MEAARTLRIALVSLLVLSAAGLAYGYAADATETTFETHLSSEGPDSSDSVVPPRENVTVVATDSNSWRGREGEGPRARAELIAFGSDGGVRYYNDSHTRYWDVDPVPGTEMTVEYMYADHLNASDCPSEWDLSGRHVSPDAWRAYLEARSTDACTENGLERVNLSTGEVTQVWSRVTPGKEATRYHDADRLNETHFVVADIYLDRVMLVNETSGATEWAWNATDTFPTSTGGSFPEDWTHVNDVEVLDDGRIMASLRNHDSVVFIDPDDGLVENWTLGKDDEHGILYEQHNPDFVPSENGGPAAVVADSENNRLVEYQREGGEWTESWVWRDARLQWPRDADRLPNGHTLVADSNGNRVFEVDENGSVVWSVNVAFPYEAERLGTGDESAGGPSAASAGIDSRTGGPDEQALIFAKRFLPGKYLNGLMYITPVWMGLPEVLELATLLASAVSLVGLAVYRRRT